MMRRTFSWLESFQFEFIFHEKQTFFDVSFPAVEVVVGINIFCGAYSLSTTANHLANAEMDCVLYQYCVCAGAASLVRC